MKLLTYEGVKEQINGGTVHLLLGSGFSISCNPVFGYQSLYEHAVSTGLSSTAKAVFEKLGTNNFEGVMQLLDDTHWVSQTYGLIPIGSDSVMQKDKEILKLALISAVAKTHLDDTGDVPTESKLLALDFLNDFTGIYTTNYDLLLYWVIMCAKKMNFQDGFRKDPDDSTSLIFSQRVGKSKGIYYLHGALHLFFDKGEHRKHSWSKTGIKLTEWVREGLSKNRYPLFVAEGDPEKKLQQIQRSGYLWYCLDKLARIESPLVIFGHSLSSSDQHIVERLIHNIKLKTIFVGLHGDPESPNSLAIQKVGAEMKLRRKQIDEKSPLEIFYYDSKTVKVWR